MEVSDASKDRKGTESERRSLKKRIHSRELQVLQGRGKKRGEEAQFPRGEENPEVPSEEVHRQTEKRVTEKTGG